MHTQQNDEYSATSQGFPGKKREGAELSIDAARGQASGLVSVCQAAQQRRSISRPSSILRAAL